MKMNQKFFLAVPLLLAVLICITAPANAASWTGTLSVENGGLVATAPWNAPDGNPTADTSTTLNWTVSEFGTYNGFVNYKYEYTFTSFKPKDISHFILQTSTSIGDDFRWTTDDLSYLLDTWGSQGNSNPNIPQDIYGIKVSGSQGGGVGAPNITFSFESTHAPVWGNFYVKNGNATYAYNSGFTSGFLFDTDDYIMTYSSDNTKYKSFVAVPDSQSRVVPEPITLVSFGTPLAMMVIGKLRRKRS